jgi:hypothetical protein
MGARTNPAEVERLLRDRALILAELDAVVIGSVNVNLMGEGVGEFGLLVADLDYRDAGGSPLPPSAPAFGDFPVSEAVDEVIVHHSDSLHVCVYDRGTHEAQSAALQVLAEGVGFRRGGGNLIHDAPAVHFGLAADKAPRVGVKSSELLLNREKRPSVAYGRLDLLPVSNDPWIEQELLDAFLRISRHSGGIESAERAAIAFTFVQDDRPVQSGLGPLQNKELEMGGVIVDRDTPFSIVVFEHQGIAVADPSASFLDHE